MAMDEEYLDNLLKSVTENEPKPRTMEEVMKEMNKTSQKDAYFPVSSDELADMLDEIEKNEQIGELTVEEVQPEVPEEVPVEAMPEEIPVEMPQESTTEEEIAQLLQMEELPAEEPAEMPPEEILADIPMELAEEVPEEAPIEMPPEFMESIPEESPVEIPEDILEAIPEESPEAIEEELMQEGAIEDEIAQLLQMEGISAETPAELPSEDMSAEMPVEFSPEFAEPISEEVSAEIPIDIPQEEVSTEIPIDIPQEEVSEEIPIDIPQEEASTEIPADIPQEEAPLEDWQADLDELLADAETQAKEAESISEPTVDEDLDVTALIDGLGQTDDDLAEISGLLKKADNNEAVGDDMLALLEGLGDDTQPEQTDGGQVPAEGAEETAEADEESGKGRKAKKRKEKKGRRKLFGKKNKDADTDGDFGEADTGSEGMPSDEMPADGLGLDDMMPDGLGIDEGPEEASEEAEGKKGAKKKEKKDNFLVRFFTFLTREEEDLDQLLDENAEIIKELNEEDDQKAKKEEKKRKKAEKKSKKGKGKKGEKAGGEEGEGGEDEDTGEGEAEGKKKKKKKKEKKEKPPKEKSKEKSVKVLSRKALLVLIAFCATIIASICILSFFLPDYADRKNARAAFYQGDYEEAYKLLYDKRLNGSDEIIFNRVMYVLKLQRKLDSYENNLALDREVEALDALMRGVQVYQELLTVDVYGGRDEVDEIYRQICTLLEQNYQMTEHDALEILEYEDMVYTQKLYSVVHGTEFTMPGDENGSEGGEAQNIGAEEAAEEDSETIQDVLPEEEALIND